MATREDLRKLQAQSLDDKVQRTLGLISEWYAYWDNQCYVSFSGGKDSTVLADIAAKWCAIAGIPLDLVFVDTGLEYPEIKEHVRTFAQYLRQKYDIDVQLTVLRPKMTFAEVIAKYGYPIISKEVSQRIHEFHNAKTDWAQQRWDKEGKYANKSKRFDLTKWKPLRDSGIPVSHMCCHAMKKEPAHRYAKETGRKAILGTMADESALRTEQWLLHGCNGFDLKVPVSNPMSFWMEQDVLTYIKTYDIQIAPVYGDIVYAIDPEQIRLDESFCGEKLCTTGYQRTGCIFCGFGAHLEKGEGRFERLKRTHPKLWRYCIYGGGYDPEDGLWKPTKEGLGMGHVFDVMNGLYGDGFIHYGKDGVV